MEWYPEQKKKISKVLDDMIERNEETLEVDPWMGDKRGQAYYALVDFIHGVDEHDVNHLIEYKEHTFDLTRYAGRKGPGGMGEGSPPSIVITHRDVLKEKTHTLD